MNWAPIAREEFRAAARSLHVRIAICGYAFVVALLPWIDQIGRGQYAAKETLEAFYPVTAMLLPIVVLATVSLGNLGETETEPNRRSGTRAGVVAGEFVGRSTFAAVTGAVGVGVGVASVWHRYGLPPLDLTVIGLLITPLFAVAYASVAVAVSAAARTRATAVAGAVGVYCATVVAWFYRPLGVKRGVETTLGDQFGVGTSADLAELAARLFNPGDAYLAVLTEITTDYSAVPWLDSPPFYLEWWFAVAILVAWAVVPPATVYYVRRPDETD